MASTRPILWRPTSRQAEFLAAPEEEVLYGGAAGGGKTDALVIDALGSQIRAVELPEYRALILRRTFPELKEVVDRTKAIYPLVYPGASYNEKGVWTFPSGARVEFGYIDRESDVHRYQSRQFQYLGWEELAQWPTSTSYMYMLSRLRSPDRMAIPCYVRATCNPDGPGARWIAEHFSIAADGGPTASATETNGHRWRKRFIPSRLSDNPHLEGTGYRERLMMLPDQVRRALLDGRWDEPIIGGAIYADQLRSAREDGRICRVPLDPGVRVDTWWDLGMADNTAIWFTQDVGREVHVIDYHEASGEGFPYYAGVLERKGYLYGRHVAPHDIRVRELGNGRSRLETAGTLGIKFEIAPQLSVEDGIHASRMIFQKCWFDSERCKPGLEALAHYRRDYNQRLGEYKATPVHDWASHGADGYRTLAVAHRIARPPAAGGTEPRRRRLMSTSGDGAGWLGA